MWSKNNEWGGFPQHCLGVDFMRTVIWYTSQAKKYVRAKSNLSPMYFPIMQSCKCQYTFTSKDLILKLKYVWNNLLRRTVLCPFILECTSRKVCSWRDETRSWMLKTTYLQCYNTTHLLCSHYSHSSVYHNLTPNSSHFEVFL